jgi:hypothetical protein
MKCRDELPDYRPEQLGRARSRLFLIRIWREEVAGGIELRGNVRDAASGAFRAFRDWSELAAFLTDCAREHAHPAGSTGRDDLGRRAWWGDDLTAIDVVADGASSNRAEADMPRGNEQLIRKKE